MTAQYSFCENSRKNNNLQEQIITITETVTA